MAKNKQKKQKQSKFFDFYDKHYKLLTILPLLLVVFSAAGLTYQMITHDGEIVNRGISLSGGLSVTVETTEVFEIAQIEETLLAEFSDRQIRVRTLEDRGRLSGYTIESNIDETGRDDFVRTVQNIFSVSSDDVSAELTDSSLGEAFFQQVIQALIFALIIMGIVVYIAFKKIVPALAIILAVIIDLLVTLTIFDLTGQYLSAAGVAAFLMIIGYSVDTNILLSSRYLKRADESLNDRLRFAFKTGAFMSLTTILTISVAFIFTNSEIISQIMLILLIGLSVDFITTWMLNAGILRWYLESQGETENGK
ncbi:MAG: hypothetical protein ACMXYA_00520 [Candidatus Woesearchaeota archaeon]